MYRLTPAKLPDRQSAVNLGQEVPVVIEVVISLVIGSTSMNVSMAVMPSRLVIALVIAAADFSPRIVREDVPSPRNPSPRVPRSRTLQDGR